MHRLKPKPPDALEIAVDAVMRDPNLATDMLWALDHLAWARRPVGIRQFITDPQHLNLPDFWPDSLNTLEQLFSGAENGVKISPYQEFVEALGIGSGKSFDVSIIFSYGVYWLQCLKDPQKFLGLESGSPICLINASTTGSQAKRVVFGNIKTRIDNSPWFQSFALPNPYVRSELQFPKNIIIFPGSSSETAPIGYNVFIANIDEASFFLDNETRNSAAEIHNVLKRRITSRFGDRGLIATTSSPRYVDDFTEKKIEEARHDSTILGIRKATWERRQDDIEAVAAGDYFELIKPGTKTMVKIPTKYQKDFGKNPKKSWRDFGGIPSLALEQFFEDDEIDKIFTLSANSSFPSCVENGEINPAILPIPGAVYRIHIDLGIVRDACGVAMSCLVPGSNRVHVPLILRIVSEKRARELREKDEHVQIDLIIGKDQVDIDGVLKLVYHLRARGFNIDMVTMDNFQSIHSRQILEKEGFKAELLSVDKDTEAYDTIKSLVNSNRLDICKHDHFCKEIQRLELVKGKKVDHPPNGSKDCADAVAGACKAILQRMDEEIESEETVYDNTLRVNISEEI